MKIGNYIKQKRIEKGYSDVDFATAVGLSVDTLYDLEQIDEDEINGLTIPQMKSVCTTLGIQPIEIYEAVTSDLKDLSLSEIVERRRQEKELSTEQVSDSIGYYASVIEAIERNEDLAEVCIDALKKLACELDLPFEFLLNKI